MSKSKHETREAWLHGAIDLLRPHFKAAGYTVPDNVKATCGWPSKGALSPRKRRIGECWSNSASKGDVFEMFISPALADHVDVLATLVHEIVHATVGLKAKHGRLFKLCALAVGLEGKMTATHAGRDLTGTLKGYVKTLGDYPHHELQHMTTGERKQGTRLLKAECAVCGYTVRVTRKWLDGYGAPLCPNKSCDDHKKPLGVDS